MLRFRILGFKGFSYFFVQDLGLQVSNVALLLRIQTSVPLNPQNFIAVPYNMLFSLEKNTSLKAFLGGWPKSIN